MAFVVPYAACLRISFVAHTHSHIVWYNKTKHNERSWTKNSLELIYIDYTRLTSITSEISLVGREIRYDFTWWECTIFFPHLLHFLSFSVALASECACGITLCANTHSLSFLYLRASISVHVFVRLCVVCDCDPSTIEFRHKTSKLTTCAGSSLMNAIICTNDAVTCDDRIIEARKAQVLNFYHFSAPGLVTDCRLFPFEIRMGVFGMANAKNRFVSTNVRAIARYTYCIIIHLLRYFSRLHCYCATNSADE